MSGGRSAAKASERGRISRRTRFEPLPPDGVDEEPVARLESADLPGDARRRARNEMGEESLDLLRAGPAAGQPVPAALPETGGRRQCHAGVPRHQRRQPALQDVKGTAGPLHGQLRRARQPCYGPR